MPARRGREGDDESPGEVSDQTKGLKYRSYSEHCREGDPVNNRYKGEKMLGKVKHDGKPMFEGETV